MQVAFELREQHKPKGSKPFAGGTFALPGGKTYDIAARLRNAAGGVIVTSDPHEIDGLRRSEALKEVPVPKKRASARKGGSKSAGNSASSNAPSTGSGPQPAAKTTTTPRGSAENRNAAGDGSGGRSDA